MSDEGGNHSEIMPALLKIADAVGGLRAETHANGKTLEGCISQIQTYNVTAATQAGELARLTASVDTWRTHCAERKAGCLAHFDALSGKASEVEAEVESSWHSLEEMRAEQALKEARIKAEASGERKLESRWKRRLVTAGAVVGWLLGGGAVTTLVAVRSCVPAPTTHQQRDAGQIPVAQQRR